MINKFLHFKSESFPLTFYPLIPSLSPCLPPAGVGVRGNFKYFCLDSYMLESTEFLMIKIA
jgi:hypothetical protein